MGQHYLLLNDLVPQRLGSVYLQDIIDGAVFCCGETSLTEYHCKIQTLQLDCEVLSVARKARKQLFLYWKSVTPTIIMLMQF